MVNLYGVKINAKTPLSTIVGLVSDKTHEAVRVINKRGIFNMDTLVMALLIGVADSTHVSNNVDISEMHEIKKIAKSITLGLFTYIGDRIVMDIHEFKKRFNTILLYKLNFDLSNNGIIGNIILDYNNIVCTETLISIMDNINDYNTIYEMVKE